MNILDETVGAENWQREHYECKGNLFCRVGIAVPHTVEHGVMYEWVWKSDCGVESNTKVQKGEASDSFKRACFNWGIGRELYTAPFIWVNADKCNIKNGKCYDTTMGLTPLEGIMMGTRCGSIDPAIVPFLMEREGWTPAEADNYMNKKCGFLGVSEISSDSRDIEAAILEGNPLARRAAFTLAYQIKKYIGSYTAAMDGVDAIVWTAGMGENNTELRERACSGLEFFGVKINTELNAKIHHQPNTVEISTADSKVKVYVLPTNEELMIASDTEAIVSKL
jgi:hypothetical protein